MGTGRRLEGDRSSGTPWSHGPTILQFKAEDSCEVSITRAEY